MRRCAIIRGNGNWCYQYRPWHPTPLPASVRARPRSTKALPVARPVGQEGGTEHSAKIRVRQPSRTSGLDGTDRLAYTPATTKQVAAVVPTEPMRLEEAVAASARLSSEPSPVRRNVSSAGWYVRAYGESPPQWAIFGHQVRDTWISGHSRVTRLRQLQLLPSRRTAPHLLQRVGMERRTLTSLRLLASRRLPPPH